MKIAKRAARRPIIALAVAVMMMAALLLSAPAYALDVGTGNVSAIEQAFLEFERALFAQLVRDGYVTEEDAQTELAMLEQLISDSEEDIIYQLILDYGMPFFSPTMAKPDMEGFLIKTYAKVSGRSEQDIAKALKAENLTVWQLAQKDGKLEELQNVILEMRVKQLDSLVRAGKITKQERDSKIERMKEKFKGMLTQPQARPQSQPDTK